MTRGRLLLLTLATLAPGCVTSALLERWDAAPGPLAHGAPGTPAPTEVVKAVRTGDGAYHLLARCSDGSERHWLADPLDAAPVVSGSWPRAARDVATVSSTTLPYLREDPRPLPDGAPLAGGVPDPTATFVPWPYDAAAPDPALAALVGPEGDAPSLIIEEHELRLITTDGETISLARVPPPRAGTTPPPPAPRASVVRRASIVLLLPLALVVDAAIGAGVVALVGGAIPLVPVILPALLR